MLRKIEPRLSACINPADPPELPPVVVTEDEAAAMLRMCRRTLQGMRLKGGGPRFIRLTSRRVGYRIADLQAWAADRLASSTSEEAAR